MDIKIKNLDHDNVGISYTLVIGKKEIQCTAMSKDIEIGSYSMEIPKEIHEAGENFGYMIRDKVKEVIQKYLSTYEGKIIASFSMSEFRKNIK